MLFDYNKSIISYNVELKWDMCYKCLYTINIVFRIWSKSIHNNILLKTKHSLFTRVFFIFYRTDYEWTVCSTIWYLVKWNHIWLSGRCNRIMIADNRNKCLWNVRKCLNWHSFNILDETYASTHIYTYTYNIRN